MPEELTLKKLFEKLKKLIQFTFIHKQFVLFLKLYPLACFSKIAHVSFFAILCDAFPCPKLLVPPHLNDRFLNVQDYEEIEFYLLTKTFKELKIIFLDLHF